MQGNARPIRPLVGTAATPFGSPVALLVVLRLALLRLALLLPACCGTGCASAGLLALGSLARKPCALSLAPRWRDAGAGPAACAAPAPPRTCVPCAAAARPPPTAPSASAVGGHGAVRLPRLHGRGSRRLGGRYGGGLGSVHDGFGGLNAGRWQPRWLDPAATASRAGRPLPPRCTGCHLDRRSVGASAATPDLRLRDGRCRIHAIRRGGTASAPIQAPAAGRRRAPTLRRSAQKPSAFSTFPSSPDEQPRIDIMSGVALKPPSPVAPLGGVAGLAGSARQASSTRIRSASRSSMSTRTARGPQT